MYKYFILVRFLFLAYTSLFLSVLVTDVCAFDISISEVEYEGRAQFKVDTASATYYYDRAGGGFSRLIDRDGKDWIAFHKEPLSKGPDAAAAGFRGLPNCVFGKDNPDTGAGHPGFEQCVSEIRGTDSIHTETKSGHWAWTWRFTESNAVFTMERAAEQHPWWFLYEGPVGGQWAPKKYYWGTNEGGPNRELPIRTRQRTDRRQWIYLGTDNSPRVLLLVQSNVDDAPDNLWFMGNSTAGLQSQDGMIVCGFGRGDDGNPKLQGAGQRFVVGLVENQVHEHESNTLMANVACDWLMQELVDSMKARRATPNVDVREVRLFGDMDCLVIQNSHALYVYGKQGAGFASILDLQGNDWISYRHGGKSAGEYRGLPKCGQPVKYFHCGYGFGAYKNDNPFESKVVINEADHLRVHSITKNSDAECEWDFYPLHATMTLKKIPGGLYWFLYEGTPGGKLDPQEDRSLRPSGISTPLSEPWKERVPWIAFIAPESRQRLVMLHHSTDSPVASYVSWPYKATVNEPLNQMTVFGFGRPDWQDAKQHTPLLTTLPAKFSVLFSTSNGVDEIQTAVQSILKNTEASGR